MNLAYLLSFSSVMSSIGGILLAVIILLAMVTIHEFGHYVAGKILGFKINEFAVGFGPALFKKRNKKTGELFALRVVPLGGYCAFAGEDEEGEEEKSERERKEKENVVEKVFPEIDSVNKTEKEKNEGTMEAITEESAYPEPKGKMFNDQPPWKRIIVLIAGATMNYLLALFIIMIMFVGFGRPHSYIVAVPDSAAQSESTEGDAAAECILKAEDVVLSVDGRDLFLPTDYIGALDGKKTGESVEVVVFRRPQDGARREKMTLTLTLTSDIKFKNMSDMGAVYRAFGMDAQKLQIVSVYMKGGFFESFGDAFVYSGKIGGIVLRSLGELLTGKLGLSAMGGPVTTIKVASEAAVSGVYSFLNIAAMIGVNLAVFNLLPIPALDGSKVVFCIIEWIRRKPINRKVEAMIHFIGIIFLFGFAILVDLLQLF